MTSSHDHGNCELCDAMERRVERAEAALRDVAERTPPANRVYPDTSNRPEEWWHGYRAGLWECGNVARKALEGEPR